MSEPQNEAVRGDGPAHGQAATQAITIRLPADLHERLRREAFESRTSQNSIIVKELTDRYKRQDRRRAQP